MAFCAQQAHPPTHIHIHTPGNQVTPAKQAPAPAVLSKVEVTTLPPTTLTPAQAYDVIVNIGAYKVSRAHAMLSHVGVHHAASEF